MEEGGPREALRRPEDATVLHSSRHGSQLQRQLPNRCSTLALVILDHQLILPYYTGHHKGHAPVYSIIVT